MYKGVTQTTGGFEAKFYFGGESTSLGVYNTEVEAALAYDITAVATLGEFAIERNFPELTEDEIVAIAGNGDGA